MAEAIECAGLQIVNENLFYNGRNILVIYVKWNFVKWSIMDSNVGYPILLQIVRCISIHILYKDSFFVMYMLKLSFGKCRYTYISYHLPDFRSILCRTTGMNKVNKSCDPYSIFNFGSCNWFSTLTNFASVSRHLSSDLYQFLMKPFI